MARQAFVQIVPCVSFQDSIAGSLVSGFEKLFTVMKNVVPLPGAGCISDVYPRARNARATRQKESRAPAKSLCNALERPHM